MDPLSDLVTAAELRAWRNNRTTKKLLRFLARWRAELVESLAEGDSIADGSIEATALKTKEAVSKAQLLKDIVELEAKDVADFYNLDEPEDK